MPQTVRSLRRAGREYAQGPVQRAIPDFALRGKEESAWEVAKRYNTTIADILAANQLEQESEIPCERLLLIPKKRA